MAITSMETPVERLSANVLDTSFKDFDDETLENAKKRIIDVIGCLIGGATGLFFTANWALGTSLVPKEEAGRYLGISNLAGAGAGAVGAYIGGPIADFFTTHVPGVPGLGYVLLFAIYGTLFFLSVVALTQVRQPSQQIQVT